MLGRIQSHYQKVKAIYKRYESFFMPALIIWGFFFHYLTFKVIPITEVLYLVFGYLALATLMIIFTHLYDQQFISQKLRYVRLFAPLVLQFAIGSIIGGVFIFYWFSGSIAVSWPFIAVIVMLLVGLEIYKHYLENLVVQLGLYTFAAYLMLAVALPYFFASINPVWFIMAGVLSLLLVYAIMWLLRKSPVIKKSTPHIILTCGLVFIIMNLFYFGNIIPPVPLSIRDSGMYHTVRQSGDQYIVESEPKTFFQRLSLASTIHLIPGDRVYIFASIYSPSELDTDIVYDWQYYNPVQKKWISESKTSFHLVGGREEGYRGFSYKTNVAAGKWRVYIETPREQVLGRNEFYVENVSQPPVLQQEIK